MLLSRRIPPSRRTRRNRRFSWKTQAGGSKPADEPEAPAAQPEQSEEAPQEHTEDALPIDEEQPAPAYENLSESQMADAIARSGTIHGRWQHPGRSTGRTSRGGGTGTCDPGTAPRTRYGSHPGSRCSPSSPLPQPEPQPVRAEPPKQPPKPEKQKAQAATKTEKKPEPKNPGTEHQKIPKSHVSSKISAAEYIGAPGEGAAPPPVHGAA